MLKRQFDFAIGEHGAEQAPGTAAPEEMLLVGRLVVGVAGREHHALDAQLHHFVEECAHAVGIGAIEKRGVRGYAEAASQRFFDAVDRLVISAFEANGKIVVLALAVHVNGKGQILARLEEMDFLLEQQRIGAEVDVFLARDQPSTISPIWGCSSGSPPGIATVGAPHSSTARKHSSGVSCAFSTCAGY